MTATELGKLVKLLHLIAWPQTYCFCSYRLVKMTIALPLGGEFLSKASRPPARRTTGGSYNQPIFVQWDRRGDSFCFSKSDWATSADTPIECFSRLSTYGLRSCEVFYRLGTSARPKLAAITKLQDHDNVVANRIDHRNPLFCPAVAFRTNVWRCRIPEENIWGYGSCIVHDCPQRRQRTHPCIGDGPV